MSTHGIDLDQLAIHLQSKMEEDGLSVRAAALQMGMGTMTLSRLLQGSKSGNVPDLVNVTKAAEWVGRPVSQLTRTQTDRHASTIGDVEVHLRALPGLDSAGADFLVKTVKASYEYAKKVREQRGA